MCVEWDGHTRRVDQEQYGQNCSLERNDEAWAAAAATVFGQPSSGVQAGSGGRPALIGKAKVTIFAEDDVV